MRPDLIEHSIDALAKAVARGCEKVHLVLEILRGLKFKGKYRIMTHIRLASLPPEIIASCHGIKYKLDLVDKLQRDIYFNLYEDEDAQAIFPLVPEGGVCVDVGANVGFYTLNFAKRVGKNGIIHAFEPDPGVFTRLEKNVRLNNFEARTYTHNLAVTNKNGSMTFYQSGRSQSAWGSVVEFKDIAVAQVEVGAITLDFFLSSQGIRKVDLLKVDVEASEFELLEGAAHSLKHQLFRYIFIEFNGIRLAERGKRLVDFLDIFKANAYRAINLNLGLLHQMVNGTVPAERQLLNLLFEAEGL